MMRPACAWCRFFELGTTTAFPTAHGECHRLPPRGPAIPAGAGWQSFPPVAATSWCGAYEELRAASPRSAERMAELDKWLTGSKPDETVAAGDGRTAEPDPEPDPEAAPTTVRGSGPVPIGSLMGDIVRRVCRRIQTRPEAEA